MTACPLVECNVLICCSSVAKALTTERCRVVMADRNFEAMDEVSKSFLGVSDSGYTKEPLPYHLVECDVTDAAQVQDLIRQADQFAAASPLTADATRREGMPEIDPAATLLVNCAGITRDSWIAQMDLQDWDDVIDVNLKATYYTCRYFLDQGRMDQFFAKDRTGSTEGATWTAGGASIVNMGSIVSELGNLGQANYAASKGGVLGLTRALAKEVAIRNIRVNAVVPGFIDTPMAQAVPEHVKDAIVKRIPLRRFGRPDEVADLVSFLLSPRSGYITGESVAISGMISL